MYNIMSKILFLCSAELSDDDNKVIHNLGSVLNFSDINSSKSANELFVLYDVIILNAVIYKDWYANYRNYMKTDLRIRIVYMYPKHTKLNDDIVDKLKKSWSVDSIIKDLPIIFANKAELIEKLLAGHLSSLDLPIMESCFKSILAYLGIV